MRLRTATLRCGVNDGPGPVELPYKPVNIARSLKHTLGYLAAKAAFLGIPLFIRPFGVWFFGSLARLVFVVPHRSKRRTIEQLRRIYGSVWSPDQIMDTARKVYIAMGKNLFDAVRLPRVSPKRFNALVSHDDLAPFKAAYDQGKGIIVITAHVGCFEMLLHFFARHGFKSFAVGRRSFDPRLDRLIRTIRSGDNIGYLDRSASPRKIIRWLQQGKAFGVLIDQDTKVEGVFAPFLGLPAFTPSAPLRIAMRFKIPVVVATTLRRPDNTHHVYLSKLLDLADTGDFEADLLANVALANDLICRTINQAPEQWLWMHRRWKTIPADGAGREGHSNQVPLERASAIS